MLGPYFGCKSGKMKIYVSDFMLGMQLQIPDDLDLFQNAAKWQSNSPPVTGTTISNKPLQVKVNYFYATLIYNTGLTAESFEAEKG